MAAELEAAFAEFDVNGDKMISKAEFIKILTREGVGQAGHLFEDDAAARLFDEFDKNVASWSLDLAALHLYAVSDRMPLRSASPAALSSDRSSVDARCRRPTGR